ncbi:apolipoprotein L5-like [Pteronotus mesoamericanus]|uniref:apolipoprotein L5-like n=1 Tax=Pteronotus mesoamericanus TaxID=1884717 RepID=UPI0023ED01B1|nr:apolipoprotein L5-like [Pteronotus parnellii mesoamericanus]
MLPRSIIELLDKLTREEMRWLLSNPQALETVLERLGLDSDEDSVLHYILVQELMRREEGYGPCGNLSLEERMFLLGFPLRKHKLEKTIKQLYTIADEVDSTHKTLTQTNLVASSASAVSAVMTILGVTLSPLTTGGSLLLSAAGQGLGTAAFVTNIVTSILENRSSSAARARASRLVAFPITPEAEASGENTFSPAAAAVDCVEKCYKVLQKIRQLRAYQRAQTNPGFMARVRNFVTTRRVPFLRATGVQSAVGQGSALAMTRGARMMSVAGAGFLLMQDVRSVLRDWQHLGAGARTEMAEELRTHAQELEQELSQLSRCYRQAILRQETGLSQNQEVGRRAGLLEWSGPGGC